MKRFDIRDWIAFLIVTAIVVALVFAPGAAEASITQTKLQELNARTALLRVEYETPIEVRKDVWATSTQGTGFLLASGRILTAGHLFNQGVTGEGRFPDAKLFTFIRTPPKKFAGGIDVAAVLLYNAPKFDTKADVRCTTPQPGERVFTIAYPGSVGPLLAQGIVAGLSALPDGRYVAAGLAVRSGVSGAPLFDGKGRLLGVLVTLFDSKFGDIASFVATADIEGVC